MSRTGARDRIAALERYVVERSTPSGVRVGSGYWRLIYDYVAGHPGATAADVGRAVHSILAGRYLLELTRRGALRREGQGGNVDPFRCYPVEVPGDS